MLTGTIKVKMIAVTHPNELFKKVLISFFIIFAKMDSQTNVVTKEQANKRTQCKAASAPHAEA